MLTSTLKAQEDISLTHAETLARSKVSLVILNKKLVYMIFNAGASVGHFNYKLPLLMQVIIFFSCYMPAILYIIGAKRNLPREYVLNEL